MCLGALQFLLYILDLPNKLHNKAKLFADDCVVYASGKITRELSSLQADLKILKEWQNSWGMEFNTSKYYTMSSQTADSPQT